MHLVDGFEAGERADAEGVDHYGASAGGGSALLSCLNWAELPSWDGRWAVAVCANDPVRTSIGNLLSSASAVAVLVGQGALRVDGEHAMPLGHAGAAGKG